MKKRLLFGALLLLSAVGFAQTIDNAFFDKVNYRGAFGATDWTAGWANFDPQNTVYPTTEKIVSGDFTTNTIWGSPLRDGASFTDSYLANSFFTPVDYVGAFGTTDWTAGWANFDPQNTAYPATTTTVSGDITVNTTWTKSNVYLMDGFIFVQNGATLTIEAGTIIRGKVGSKAALIVSRGGKLIANGTVTEPIVFTSDKNAGSRAAGDWAGLVILGKATNNQGNDMLVEGGFLGQNARHGGTDDTDNSGSLKYVRLEYPGYAFADQNEINGLTMGSVGSGTTIDYVQVSYSNDDSYEWFGGTVNCKHLIAYAGLDDDFDTDNGYRGMVQFAVGLRHPSIDDESTSGTSNGFESDNNGTSPYTGSPETAPIFSNVSLFGPYATTTTTTPGATHWGRAMHIRRNSKLSVFNSVFAGYKVGLYLDGSLTATAASTDVLKVQNCVMSGMTTSGFGITGSSFDITTWFNNVAKSNLTVTNNTDLFLKNAFSLSTPDFRTYAPTYLMDGFVFVQDGITLKIKPGTVIRGNVGSKAALIVSRGGKLIANGTATEPIIFTSNKNAGSRAAGDWAGLVILGKANNNQGNNMLVEGGFLGDNARHGGTDDTDNSGSLKYVRLEYPGYAFADQNEINGLTMGSVGSGTTIDYVQVSYSNDDSYEWFGGTVNCKHLIAYAGLDDDFDTDNGYRGMVQFAVGLRHPSIDDESTSGTSNGFESDNNGTSPYTGSPETAPIFSNVSLFGPYATTTTPTPGAIHWGRAMHIRRNSRLSVFNSVFAGYKIGLYLDGSLTATAANTDVLKVQNCVMSGMTTSGIGITGGGSFDITTWFNNATKYNQTISSNADLTVTDPFTLTAPNFLPKTTSMLKSLSYWNTNVATYANNMPIVAKAYVNGAQLTAVGSKLTASKNGVVRGWTTIGGNNLFSLSAGSASTTESDLDLELYDASTQKSYSLPTTFNFNSASSFGIEGSPVDLQATASLTIPVGSNGYTWISFNVLPEDNSLNNVLNYNAVSDDEIFSQAGNGFYVEGDGWLDVDKIEKNKMYIIKTSSQTPGSITVTNQPLVKNTPVSIANGYTWLGYSLNNSYNVNEAFAGLTLNDEDELFAQAGNDVFIEGSWLENNLLYPGRGYILKTTSPSTYNFPTNQLGSAVKAPAQARANSAAPTSWVSPGSNMKNTASIYAEVYKGDVLYKPAGLTIAVFKDGVCRGVKDTYSGTKQILNISYYSNESTESGFNFKVYDPTTDMVYDAVETVGFTNLQSIGSYSNPMKITISTTSVKNPNSASNFSVYPNPVNDIFQLSLNTDLSTNAKIDLFDLQGKLIQTIYNGVLNNNVLKVNRDKSISKGMYMIKATVSDKQYNAKVILN